jgi:hypothetical protein
MCLFSLYYHVLPNPSVPPVEQSKRHLLLPPHASAPVLESCEEALAAIISTIPRSARSSPNGWRALKSAGLGQARGEALQNRIVEREAKGNAGKRRLVSKRQPRCETKVIKRALICWRKVPLWGDIKRKRDKDPAAGPLGRAAQEGGGEGEGGEKLAAKGHGEGAVQTPALSTVTALEILRERRHGQTAALELLDWGKRSEQ